MGAGVDIVPGVAPDPEPTRRKLVDAAIRLFAEHGVQGVSRAQIVREAEQRNTAALVYHFGDLDGVLRVIVDENMRRVRERRMVMLAEAVAASGTAVRPIVRALVVPIADLADGDARDRACLRIHAEVTGGVWSADSARDLVREGGAAEVEHELARRCPGIPADLLAERCMLLAAFVVRSASARATALALGRDHEFRLSHGRFVANLIDVAVAGVTAPISPEAMPEGSDVVPGSRAVT